MIESMIGALSTYVYSEYVIAVIVITALVRKMFSGIDYAIHPKWVTLVVATILGMIGYAFRTLSHQEYELFKVLTSFGVSCLGYDYLWKPIQDSIRNR